MTTEKKKKYFKLLIYLFNTKLINIKSIFREEHELNEENELDGEDGEDLDDNFVLDTCSKQKSLIPSNYFRQLKTISF